MNTFSLLSLISILFLCWGHLTEEKKLPAQRNNKKCAENEILMGKCDNLCENWNKASESNCSVEIVHDEIEEGEIAICYCSLGHDTTLKLKNVYECLLNGCCSDFCDYDGFGAGCNNKCENGGECSYPLLRHKEEQKLVPKTSVVAQCSEGDALRTNCAQFCKSWDELARSVCAMENFENDEFSDEAACYCSLESVSYSPSESEVIQCLNGRCLDYTCYPGDSQ